MFCIIHNRPGIVNAVEEFKLSVYGENYEEGGESNVTEASRKRKAIADKAVEQSANYDWENLADSGKVHFPFETTFCFM